MILMDRIREALTPQERRIIAEDARQALENKHWREAFAAVEVYLVERAKQCDPDNREKAQRIVISMQLMEAIKRELVRTIEDGEKAKVEIEGLERKSAIRRFVR